MKNNILLSLLTVLLFFTVSKSFSQVTIFTEGFENHEGYSIEGALSTTPVGNNGWRSSHSAVCDANNWGGYSTGSYPISGRSLMIAGALANCTQYPGQYLSNRSTDKFAYVTVNASGYENITLEFQWRAYGDLYNGILYDYGMVTYNTGSGWQDITTGGTYGNGRYGAGDTNVRTATVTFPVSANNKSFQFGFRWKNDNVDGYAPAFVVDNIVVKGTPISTDRTLTVSEAYTGASYANGSHTFANNTSVTATSGTRAGYNIVGWEGTGSVPATGTGGTATFNITANSTINWIWQQIGVPNNVLFHNHGGDQQLAFNNSRIDTNTPIFRLSHATDPATDYQIEINTSPTFTGGTSWNQTFTGTYPLGTEANFTFTDGFTPTNNTTYYVRARVKGEADVWSDWTTQTYSFTYQTPKEIPDWFQTTQAQFQTDSLSGVNANASGDVVTIAGGNAIVNGDFETNTTGWTKSSNYSADYYAVRSTAWASTGTASLQMYHNNPGSTGYFSNDYVSMYQTVDLTGVSTLQMDANYSGAGSVIVQLRVYVAETTQATGTTGTLVHTWVPPSNASNSTININLSSYGFIGNKVVKIVYYVTGQETAYNMRYLSVDNIRTTSLPQGTITSTPIHLASVQEAIGYQSVKWNQTLNSGELTLKIQHSADGETGWADVPGYTAISTTGDGEQSYDLSSMTAYPHIRLVGNLNGEDVTLHDWAVEFMKVVDDCPTTTTWDGSSWSNGIPDELTKRIIFDGNFSSANTNTISGNLTGCTLEVVSGNVIINSGHSITLDNEIIITGGTFTLENDASLVQNNDVVNSGYIKVKRNTTNMVKFDATYWSSPVAEQNLRGFSQGTLTNRFYIYNGYNAAPDGISQHFKAVFVNDANYPMPNPIPAEWEVPASELNGNLFKMDAYTFKPGWGYSIRVPNNWHHALGTEGDVLSEEFDGVPHNGEVIVPAYGKYTMVGNPYPSPIQTMGPQGFFEANENVGTLHFWTHHFDVTELPEYNTNYVTYTSLGSAGNHPGVTGEPIPNGIIAVAQGFVVENTNIAEEQSTQKWDVIFRNEMRTKESGIFFKENHDEGDRHRYWINLTNESDVQIAQILVGYTPEATYEVDHQIDGRRMGTAPLFSWIGENDYTVQGRPMPFEIEDIVPLGYVANRDGKYKMSLHGFDGFFSDEIVRIYIRDNQTQEEHDLMSSDYWFESVEGEYPNRFEIFYKVEEVLDNEELDLNAIQIYHEGANIMVKSSKEKILSVELWDISGRKLHQNQKVNSHLYSISKSNFGTQVLLVTVMTERGEIKRKKIINY